MSLVCLRGRPEEVWSGRCVGPDLVSLLRTVESGVKAVRFCRKAWSTLGKGLVYASGRSLPLLCREWMTVGQVRNHGVVRAGKGVGLGRGGGREDEDKGTRLRGVRTGTPHRTGPPAGPEVQDQIRAPGAGGELSWDCRERHGLGWAPPP